MQEKRNTQKLRKAKEHLAQNQLSYRQAAAVLGCCYQHLSDVLNGHRVSHRLIEKIMKLSTAEVGQ